MIAPDSKTDLGSLQVFVNRRWPIIPVVAGSKKPLFTWDKASCDPEQIGLWQLSLPNCNWAMLTGSRSGIFVLDCDVYKTSAERWLEEKISTFGTSWMETAQVATGNGGIQFLFQQPNFEVKNSTGEIYKNIDVRGAGGIAIVPPSVTSGPYTWRNDPTSCPIRTAPDWLLSPLREQKSSASRSDNDNGNKIEVGRRNSVVCSTGGLLRRHGLSASAIEPILQTLNTVACDPPLPANEVSGVASSVSKYPPEAPEPKLIIPRRPITHRSDASELFETAAAFAQAAPVQTSWSVQPFIPAGGMAELVGKIKASGKTTFALAMTRSVLDGALFLNQPCSKSPVVYLTEQGESSLHEALARADLLGRNDLFLLRWHRAMGMPWNELSIAAVTKAEQVSAKLLVVDTLSQFSQLAGDAENSSGQALEVLRPLQAAQAKCIAVLLVRHERKGDAEIANSGRGSSAFSGAVDTVMRLQRLGDKYPATFRRLECLSRFVETPADSIIELTPEGYVWRDVAQVSVQVTNKKLLEALSDSKESAKTCLELTREINQPRTNVQRALTDLVNSGAASRTGAGIRGLAYRYYFNPRKGEQ